MPQGRRGRKEVPRTASCASASLQRGKDFPVASEGRSVKGAVPGQEDGKNPGEGREDATKSKEKEKKQCTPPQHVEAVGCKKVPYHNRFPPRAMVPNFRLRLVRTTSGDVQEGGKKR